jgi:hypothetical protein
MSLKALLWLILLNILMQSTVVETEPECEIYLVGKFLL